MSSSFFRMHARSPLLALTIAALGSACGGGGGGPSPVAATTSTTGTTASGTPQIVTGHYVGAVTIADVTYFGDAVVTEDGAIRLYVGGTYDDGGELQVYRPKSSEQFVGTLKMQDGQWSGSGVVIGQECASDPANPFCGQSVPANFSANVSLASGEAVSANLEGSIEVLTPGGAQSWSLDLGLWGDDGPLAPAQYQEMLAEFATGSNVLVSLDADGRLFFQSAGSGCVGNGTWAAHSAGPADIYDVTLQVESCTGAYAYLNGTYDGLALTTPSSVWDYDAMLRVWLSKGVGDAPPAALTMLGE